MDRPGADFLPLIQALTAASLDPNATLEQQLNAIELSLVEAELNPNPIALVELTYSLKALREINPEQRITTAGTADLAPFFEDLN